MMEWLSNFGMREWLISCGVVLVLVVLFDGYRRMRSEHKNTIKMARRMGGGFPDTPATESFSSELPNGGARVIERSEPTFDEQQNIGAGSEFHNELARLDASAEATIAASVGQEAPAPQFVNDHQILVLHARSRSAQGFNGSDLLQILLACDLRYGDRDILHRHERAGGSGSLQFSVANMVEPGTFNLEDIKSFRTPGVSFFMTVPGPDEPEQA
ncbi:MAG: hypothetical protein KJO24_04020, partial [Gammaproteobacteria bacterium]|nr:hypothetical protein [Gammaproteobacteria bacterium]